MENIVPAFSLCLLVSVRDNDRVGRGPGPSSSIRHVMARLDGEAVRQDATAGASSDEDEADGAGFWSLSGLRYRFTTC